MLRTRPELATALAGAWRSDGAALRGRIEWRHSGGAASQDLRTRPLRSLLRHRRSPSAFADASVSADLIQSLAASAVAADIDVWQPSTPLAVLAVVIRRDTLGPGRRLLPVLVSSDSRRALPTVAVAGESDVSPHPHVAEAAALLLALGDLRAVCSGAGAHGYRELLVRAGYAIETALVGALENELVGRPIRGFHRRPIDLMLRDEDPLARRPMLGLALGHPANPDAAVQPTDLDGDAAGRSQLADCRLVRSTRVYGV